MMFDPFPLTLEEIEPTLRYIPFVPSTWQPALAVSTVPDASPLALEIRDLSVSYGRQQVLDHLTFSVPEGTFLALVGANGAGKTTLSQLMVGILRPPSGTMLLHGRDITRIPARELMTQVGYVFQNPEHQFITDSVADEISYGLRVMKLPEQEIAQRTQALLARFGLEKRARSNPFTLSHGEKRRLSVATMLAIGQQVLILDEPTFGQDQRNARELLTLLSALHAEGRTIIVVTHDMSLVAEYAQQVLVLHQGKQLFLGPPGTLFQQPDVLARARLSLPPLAALSQRLDWPTLLTVKMLEANPAASQAHETFPQEQKG